LQYAHELEVLYANITGREHASVLSDTLRSGRSLNAANGAAFKATVLYELALMDHEKNGRRNGAWAHNATTTA
jgi:hypothetical protein